jgi:glycine cleavage system H protein
MEQPDDRRYTTTHEWVQIVDDLAVVGITQHAVAQLGDLAFIDLPESGTEVSRGDPFGEIESTKTASQLFAPVSGQIVEVHTALIEELQRIVESPFEEGWLVRIQPSNPAELEDLLSSAEYDRQVVAEDDA